MVKERDKAPLFIFLEKRDDLGKDAVERKLKELRVQTKAYISEIEMLIAGIAKGNAYNMVCYFTHAFRIDHAEGGECLCLASFHLLNLGSEQITNPSICIQMPPDSLFEFSGRYVVEGNNSTLKIPNSWERFNNDRSPNEIWLRPIEQNSIQPNESIAFTNFQVKWSPASDYAGSIIGVVYCDQNEKGSRVLNPINLNGSIPKQEDKIDK